MAQTSFPIFPARRWEGKCAPCKRPKEIAFFSYDENHEYHCDDSSMSYYYTPKIPSDLCHGFDNFKKCEPGDEHLDNLLRTLIELEKKTGEKVDTEVVTWRGMMTKLLQAPFEDRDGFEMNATLYQGTIYIEENYEYRLRQQAEQARQQQQRQQNQRRGPQPPKPSGDMMTYWGYKFETLSTIPNTFDATPRSYIDSRPTLPVSNAAQYVSIVSTGIGSTSLVLGGEVDCIWDARPLPPSTKLNWVELKTSAELRSERDREFFIKKTLRFWLQSFLLGVPKIVVGFRDQQGMLKRVEEMETSALPAVAKRAGSWDGNVAINFGAAVLEWLKQSITDQGVYRIARLPGRDVTVTRIEETGHGKIITDEFLNHRIKLAMGSYKQEPAGESEEKDEAPVGDASVEADAKD